MLPPIVDNISQSIGSTLMIRLTPHNKVNILAKLEFTNPTGSVKDRLAKYLLDEHEKNNSVDKKIKTLIIPTSENLGISVATLAARRGYRIISILPERTSNNRIALLKALGVEILRSPNEAKPDAAGIDFLFVGAESGTMLTSVARYLKDKIPELKVIEVEPTDSVLGGGQEKLANRYDWKVEDSGNNFVTKSLDKSIVIEWIKILDKEAFSAARRLIRDEGILCRLSSGAMVTAAAPHAQTVVSDHNTHIWPCPSWRSPIEKTSNSYSQFQRYEYTTM
ncbi:hypothetical protein CU097_008626 [Rhizopus azygosporus]|uniref:Tryptophan synthase beta chain-like PALP domain-containing protein n=1 Tax=Rhizopus azygosporus TaxID=86630 RepID=A0A367JNI5_RHIAZ|nr:hypothetical protein CU097_008626 [Rhizopus azygosporus]